MAHSPHIKSDCTAPITLNQTALHPKCNFTVTVALLEKLRQSKVWVFKLVESTWAVVV